METGFEVPGIVEFGYGSDTNERSCGEFCMRPLLKPQVETRKALVSEDERVAVGRDRVVLDVKAYACAKD